MYIQATNLSSKRNSAKWFSIRWFSKKCLSTNPGGGWSFQSLYSGPTNHNRWRQPLIGSTSFRLPYLSLSGVPLLALLWSSTSGPDDGVRPICRMSVDFLRASILRKGSGSKSQPASQQPTDQTTECQIKKVIFITLAKEKKKKLI